MVKNALMLYIRILLSIVVSLYTTRVILNTLGVVDYGIYGVVGGVIGMFYFLNASMSGATSRFLTFEMGKGNFQRLKDTFSSALIIHIGIALIIFVLAETIGLWFLMNRLVIPETRMYAAHWVYQLSILSMIMNVTQVPYNASIIAHEKMDVYAYVEILNVTLKLLIVYLLVIGDFDKLILYAILTLAVSVVIALIYRFYCIRRFAECYFHWIWKPEILKPMLSFSGWDLFGNMSFTFKLQGLSFILNIFWGVLLNTANAVAMTVEGVISGFSYNIIQVFRPQIVKAYAINDLSSVESLIRSACKYSVFMLMLISIPLCFEIRYVMGKWLEVVPDYAPEFCQVLLLQSIFNVINACLIIGIHATGRITKFSLYNGLCNLILLPVLYLIFKFVINEPIYAYFISFLFTFITVVINIYIFKSQIPMIKIYLIVKSCLITILICILPVLPLFLIIENVEESIVRLLYITFSYVIMILFLGYYFLLNQSEKDFVVRKIRRCK